MKNNRLGLKLALFTSTTLIFSCGNSARHDITDESKEIQSAKNDSLERHARRVAINARHGKTLSWESLDFHYTLSYQNAFEQNSKLLIDASRVELIVLDIWKADSTIVFLLKDISNYNSIAYFQLSCVTDCSSLYSDVDRIEVSMFEENQVPSQVVIIADIESIHRANQAVQCKGESNGPDSEISTSIELDHGSTPPFLLKGRILDILD